MNGVGNIQTADIADFGIIVNPADNVAVVKKETFPELRVTLPDGRVVEVESAVPLGHRFAILDIPQGEFVLQFGQPIGTSLGIREGQLISHTNMTDDVPLVRDLPPDLQTAAPDYFAEHERPFFYGFRRPDGRTGTRNFVLIVPTSMCASHEAQQISTIPEYTIYSRQHYPNLE